MVSDVSQWPEQTLLDAWMQGLPEQGRADVAKAVQWVQTHYVANVTLSGEPLLDHVSGAAQTLATLNTDAATRVAAILMCVPPHQGQTLDPIQKQFGPDVMKLMQGTRALLKLRELTLKITRQKDNSESRADQKEMLRKMLLAMAADLRIVLIRLASRLQTLRWAARTKAPCDPALVRETLDLYAPLANRLGIWQLKWEMEDLAFRFLEPERYRDIARRLEATRGEREAFIEETVARMKNLMQEAGIDARIYGRPKHIYSIWNKMRNKEVDFSRLYDLRALRVIVPEERDCYGVLSIVHSHWHPITEEFDDYIARPKPNGYRSLHTVVEDESGRAFEIQIRTQAMHEFAEYGMAAHWRYKESGTRGGQTTAGDAYSRQLAWMRQLVQWQTDADRETGAEVQSDATSTVSDRIYVLSPHARVIELPRGATPVDFAYYLHTDLGHRCRGAKVEGQMVPLNTPLETGQTVEIMTTKAGGPSRDWLNPQLGYLVSPRSRAKVRSWFNAVELQQRIVQGHTLVDKELARLGKTAVNHEQLSQKLGFARADDLYVAVAKDDFSLKNIETAVKPATPESTEKDDNLLEQVMRQPPKERAVSESGVLVQGVGSLLTQLARCCRPAPPDPIGGFVTRGRGVSIHRQNCPSFQQLLQTQPQRVIDVSWDTYSGASYPVDIVIRAKERTTLLRDLSEAFARLRLNVVGVNTHSRSSLAHMVFTVEVTDGEVLTKALATLNQVPGVVEAERR
ncbi:RelA/SpoT family protein [Orrella sp. 11846]|uniref:RelA/SpoT family protein n=1 Tax=Orrella sp. 11846 TaxID=3409913 RepID=UPI003B5917F0